MRCRVVVPSVLLAVSLAPAQGEINPSLLKPFADEGTSPARRAGPAGLVAAVRRSLVWVAVEVDGPDGKFFIQRASSGVIVDAAGLVVTHGHLVREAIGADDKRLLVQLEDAENSQLEAALVRLDEASGLALLRIAPPAAGLHPATLGSDLISTGEPVVVVARPEGKEMLAFAGVASASLATVALDGRQFAPAESFLTDTRNDERCDGAPVFDAEGLLAGLYASEHVQRDKSEPTLEELKLPSFGVVVAAGRIRRAFAAEFAAVTNRSLQQAPAAVVHPQVAAVQRIAPSVVSVWAGEGDWPALGGKDPGGVVRRPGLGSGVVLGDRGLVVTNRHLLAGERARVKLGDGTVLPAKQVRASGAINMALLQVELPAGRTLVAAAGNPDDDAILGEVVLAVGNPLGTQVVVTAGVVSAKRGREGGRIQADANLGNQNGGGAVVDVHGRLLGIGDAGAVDPIEVAFAMRGDRVSTETNLSTFVAISRIRRAFAAELDAAESSIRTAVAVSETERGQRNSALTRMVQRTAGAMLNVYIERNTVVAKEDDLVPPEPKWVPVSLGSGVVVDPSGLAISNWHVVDDATNPDGSMVGDHRVTVRVFGGKKYEVKVLSISREDDLSLLQLQLAPGERVQAVEFGSSEALALGEAVAAIGNPHGQDNTITFGVVSDKGHFLRIRNRFEKLGPLLETDAAINGGNSGGALLDMNGRLVGINSAGGGTFNNRGYAIEVDHVRKQVLALLFSAHKLRSPDLGLRLVDEDGAVRVFDVHPRGSASRAGVLSGDRILALDDTAITWSPGFAMTLLQKAPGADVALRLERAGRPLTLTMKALAPEVWAVVRQSGLLTRDFAFAEDPDRVQEVTIALHQQFSGTRPTSIPERVVAIEQVFAGEQPPGTDLLAGDLLLAVELVQLADQVPVLKTIADVRALRDLWNAFGLSDYQGSAWSCWIARGRAVRKVEITAKRLFW